MMAGDHVRFANFPIPIVQGFVRIVRSLAALPILICA